MGLALLILQLTAAATPAPPAAAANARPDIEIDVRVRAKSLRIETEGEARLEVRAEPSAGQSVEVAGKLPPGARAARNLDLRLRAAAAVADPRAQPDATTITTTGEPKP